MADEIEIRALRESDDLDAQLDLAQRAFGPRGAADEAHWRRMSRIVVASGRSRAAFDRGRPAGAAVYYDMRQWWHGRPVPMAGVSGVKVSPEDRGRGIGKRLMTGLLDDIAARGYPLSVLYPATMPLYRSLGWEVAGARYTAEAPAWVLRSLVPPDLPEPGDRAEAPGLRRAGASDAGAVHDVIGRVLGLTQDNGPIAWDEAVTEAFLGREHRYAYLCDDGFTWYNWYDGNDGIFVGGVQAASAASTRALWSLIASHGTIASTFRFSTHPGDPIWQLAADKDIEIRSTWHWMLRVVDAAAAVAARGFPPAVSAAVPLIIIDQHRPANAGRWLLTIDGGKGELTRRDGGGGDGSQSDGSQSDGDGGDGALILGARGLAALYGGATVSSLRVAGLARGGDPAADGTLDAAFSGTAAYLLDTF